MLNIEQETFEGPVEHAPDRDFIGPDVSVHRPPVSQQIHKVRRESQTELLLRVIELGLRVTLCPPARLHVPLVPAVLGRFQDFRGAYHEFERPIYATAPWQP